MLVNQKFIGQKVAPAGRPALGNLRSGGGRDLVVVV